MTTPKKLVLNSLRNALATLDEVLEHPEMDDIVRDATIKRFEYTYETSWKMMKRHLEWLGHLEIQRLSRRELFRKSAEVGLIHDAEAWFTYHEARNLTSHTYNEKNAQDVLEAARNFAPAARRLLRQLEATHD